MVWKEGGVDLGDEVVLVVGTGEAQVVGNEIARRAEDGAAVAAAESLVEVVFQRIALDRFAVVIKRLLLLHVGLLLGRWRQVLEYHPAALVGTQHVALVALQEQLHRVGQLVARLCRGLRFVLLQLPRFLGVSRGIFALLVLSVLLLPYSIVIQRQVDFKHQSVVADRFAHIDMVSVQRLLLMLLLLPQELDFVGGILVDGASVLLQLLGEQAAEHVEAGLEIIDRDRGPARRVRTDEPEEGAILFTAPSPALLLGGDHPLVEDDVGLELLGLPDARLVVSLRLHANQLLLEVIVEAIDTVGMYTIRQRIECLMSALNIKLVKLANKAHAHTHTERVHVPEKNLGSVGHRRYRLVPPSVLPWRLLGPGSARRVEQDSVR